VPAYALNESGLLVAEAEPGICRVVCFDPNHSLTIAGIDFTITANTCLAASVAAGGTCTVNVAFAPTAGGARSATLQIADNAAGSPQGVLLRGTGVAPAPPPATFVFGTQTVSAVSDSNAAGTAEAFKVTSAQSGTVSQLRVYVDAGSTGSLTAGLYANSASNHPGALLTSGTLAAPVAGQFNTVVVPNLTVTSGTSYWIALLDSTGVVKFRDSHGSGNSETNTPGGLTALPGGWTTGGSFTDGALSAYAAGTVTTPPPPPPPPPGLSLLVGNGTTEAQADNNAAGRAEAFKTTASASGSVTQLRVYIDLGNTATSVRVGLYSNNPTTNRPQTLLTSGTISAPTAGANNNVAVTGASVTAGQTYWIALLTPSGTGQVVRFRDRAQPSAALGQSEWSSSATLTALPATWASGTQFRDGFLSAIGLG